QNGEGGAGDGGELLQIVRNNQAVVTTPQQNDESLRRYFNKLDETDNFIKHFNLTSRCIRLTFKEFEVVAKKNPMAYIKKCVEVLAYVGQSCMGDDMGRRYD
ncbi:hypothetical protein TcasGA2_TC035040, partial [Tribolium castaneum]